MIRILTLILIASLLMAATVTGTSAAFDPFKEAAIEAHFGEQIPLDGTFRDEVGRPVSLRSLARGRPIILAPVLHKCPNICGVTLGALSDALTLLPLEMDFVTIGFGIDPNERPADAAEALAALAKRQNSIRAVRPIHALTGEADEIAAVTKALGYRYAFDLDLGQYAHVAAIAVLTPEGHLVRWLPGLAPDPQELGKAIALARDERVASLGGVMLLLCYHYDPVTGRYSFIVSRIIQILSLAMVIGLAGFVGISAMRERRHREGNL